MVLNVIADDAVRHALNQAFQKAVFSVREARSGLEALRLADEVPALVALDARLPDLPGAEVCNRLRYRPGTAATPVLHVAAPGGPPAAAPDGTALPALSPERVVARAQSLLWASRTEHLFRGFLEAAPDAVALADAAGAIVYVNARLEGLFG
ncbi:response regulator [Urbifossiella limnaea]|uniref:Transcriptional regulatory protein SrrA n=1 Tax=Urbifossiella limnaea TaxID=2528023 RepID=A0A517XWI3_9BACT|nr:response regulator [Urbifossiella limnaea]QDU21834.1 Transcriptional regulatory protein SrrA [Urbifossiella limnaea]